MEYVGGTWWELQIADGWSATEHEECLTLYRSNLGAFQLSAAVKTHGAVLPSEVEAQSHQGSPDNTMSLPFKAGEFVGLTVSHEEDDTYWQRFWLAHGNIMVFATYNGSHETWLSERSAVYAMLATLRPRAMANVWPA